MKKEISSKKFIKTFFVTFLILAVLVVGLVVFFDPFYHYHKPLPFLKSVLSEKEYQVPGSLDHFDYDAVILGSSVAENYNNRWFDDNFDCRSIKAIRSYGATYDLIYYLNRAFDTHELKYVFMNLDPTSVTRECEDTFEFTGAPLYLYDKNPVNDIEYLLNKDVLFKQIPYTIASSYMRDYDEGESYNWYSSKTFSKDAVFSHYYRSTTPEPVKDEDYYMDLAKQNVALIKETAEKHPETQFYIFIPPYSIVWWDSIYNVGETGCYLKAEKYAVSELLKEKNIRVFNFQQDLDIVYNLDLFMDSLHFSQNINHVLCDYLKEGKYEIKDESDMNSSFEIVSEYAFNAAEYLNENYGDDIQYSNP